MSEWGKKAMLSAAALGEDGIRALAKRIEDAACPHCGRVLESVSSMHDGKIVQANPQPGQFVICIGCASFNVFDDKLQQRPATEEEIAALSHEDRQELMAARRLIKILYRIE